jgi:hypothetical protein
MRSGSYSVSRLACAYAVEAPPEMGCRLLPSILIGSPFAALDQQPEGGVLVLEGGRVEERQPWNLVLRRCNGGDELVVRTTAAGASGSQCHARREQRHEAPSAEGLLQKRLRSVRLVCFPVHFLDALPEFVLAHGAFSFVLHVRLSNGRRSSSRVRAQGASALARLRFQGCPQGCSTCHTVDWSPGCSAQAGLSARLPATQ